ncbi:hypothetical protein Q1695_008170 [Nippostrongylus brasiliensis]|nr:hypothetical protein Q1695_008170 [Nippostrongylus brasiliensis]
MSSGRATGKRVPLAIPERTRADVEEKEDDDVEAKPRNRAAAQATGREKTTPRKQSGLNLATDPHSVVECCVCAKFPVLLRTVASFAFARRRRR